MPDLTWQEFERRYAEGSGWTVEYQRAKGMWPERCDCGEVRCEGWQLVSERTSVMHHDRIEWVGVIPWEGISDA